MTNQVKTSMPQGISNGIDDQSAKLIPLEPSAVPQFLCLVPTFAKEGPTTMQLVSGNTRFRTYGAESFDERGKYATHATVLSNDLNEAANPQMMLRMEPPDAGPPANVLLYVDVLPCKLDEYERNSDGSFKLNPITRQPIVKTANGINNGLKLRFGLKTIDNKEDFALNFGGATQEVGEMTAGAVQSTIYPIFQGALPWFGAAGNLKGFRMWGPTDRSRNPVNRDVLIDNKVYPNRFMFVSKDNETQTAAPIPNLASEQSIEFTFRSDIVSKKGVQLSLMDAIKEQYVDNSDPNVPQQFAPMSSIHIYDENVQTVLELIMNAEKMYADENSDITALAEGDDMWLMNMFNAASSYGVPYTAVQVVGAADDGINMTETASHFAMSGSDGTMSLAVFDQLVADEIAKFADPDHPYSDVLRYPVSVFVDTGYGIDYKQDLVKFIANRHDTYVILSTHTVGSKALTATERSSLGEILSAYIRAYPESTYYGTEACRGTVVGSGGRKLGSAWSKRSGNMGALPLTLWLASKSARYMGAENGKWKSEYRFDVAPGNIIDNFTDVDVEFTPVGVRKRDWAVGMIYPQFFDMRQMFFAGVRTVYSNQTSVLTGYNLVIACCFLEKIGLWAWRKFTGSQRMSAAEREVNVAKYIEEECTDRFDDSFVIKARCYHTKLDEALGYQFHTEITIGGEPMTTVMVFNLVARRVADMTETAA